MKIVNTLKSISMRRSELGSGKKKRKICSGGIESARTRSLIGEMV